MKCWAALATISMLPRIFSHYLASLSPALLSQQHILSMVHTVEVMNSPD